ncbi:MAG: inositol monophosphatase [bacterium]
MSDIAKEELERISKFSVPAVLNAGDFILNNWNKSKSLTYKDLRDVVTNVDIEVENMLRERLGTIFPEAGFIVEEGESSVSEGYNWAIDPIDGTKNYANSAPLFYTQIALLKKYDPIFSIIYNPVSKQLFRAIKGGGAYLNDILLRPNNHTTLARAIVDIDTGPLNGANDAWKLDLINMFGTHAYRLRITAGFFGLYISTGAVDIFIKSNFHAPPTIKEIVDSTPHMLIMEETGNKPHFLAYKNSSILICTNDVLFDEVQKAIYHFLPSH